MLMECSDDAAPDVSSDTRSAASATGGTSRSPEPTTEATSTQTEVLIVKKEEEDPSQTEREESVEEQSSGVNCVEQGDVKQESDGVAHSANEGTAHLDSGGDAGPFCADITRDSPNHQASMMEVQEQQDQLVELMQAIAQERDTIKEQVQKLTSQLRDTQSRLQEINVKKECSHQASQTEETEEEKDYKSLFEKAKQKIDELIKDKEALLANAETKPSDARREDLDEIALQVDCLLRELDQRNNERDELRLKLDSLEEERANLASQCEELRLSLQQLQQQQREKAQEESTRLQKNTDSSAQTDPEEVGGTSASGTDSISDRSSLVELRHNIGRLLVYHVPALDLDQVNFECNVIDEILEQVLLDEETIATVVKNRARNK
ncbi:MORC family CW-type zinc finger protein 3 [Larimichthys crocea]|uniref:Uncharacterized protein n=1 Tax=Larimichthys crocea TaxID=215358 RepID=A0ACD3QIF2_LARCR|nr:MORC family CW-type zinc finger protein 3 [Larimichthys crocea]